MKDFLNKIVLGDCMDLMPKIPDNSIDLIVSDIPYKIATGGARISEESQKKFSAKDPKGILNRRTVNNPIKAKWLKQNDTDSALFVSKGKLFEHADIKFDEWLPEAYRVLKENSHAYFMVNSRNLKELQKEAENVGFKFQNLLVWAKNNATPNHYYMQQCEFILFLRKGKAKDVNNMGITNLLNVPNIIGSKLHPTEKPVKLMKILIEQSSSPGDIVLDPFCGSGTTIIAANETNRQFMGFEIDERFFEIAKNRLKNIQTAPLV